MDNPESLTTSVFYFFKTQGLCEIPSSGDLSLWELLDQIKIVVLYLKVIQFGDFKKQSKKVVDRNFIRSFYLKVMTSVKKKVRSFYFKNLFGLIGSSIKN